MTNRFAIISSSGGSAFLAAHEALHHHEFRVLTDRSCGMEEGCRARGIPYVRIEESDNRLFSERVAEDLRQNGPFDAVFLYFSRLVTEPLISQYKMINFHPALLPAFKGISALRQTLQLAPKFFGATAHCVSEGMDDGPIIAQVCQPLPAGMSARDAGKASFIHKAYLLLLCVDLLETGDMELSANGAVISPRRQLLAYANPGMKNAAYLQHILRLQASEGVVFA